MQNNLAAEASTVTFVGFNALHVHNWASVRELLSSDFLYKPWISHSLSLISDVPPTNSQCGRTWTSPSLSPARTPTPRGWQVTWGVPLSHFETSSVVPGHRAGGREAKVRSAEMHHREGEPIHHQKSSAGQNDNR